MPIATLTFNLPEENEDFKLANKAGAMSAALFEVQQQVWRPSYKHGYSDIEISSLINKINEVLEPLNLKDNDGDNLCAESLIAALMKKYHSILNEYEVND